MTNPTIRLYIANGSWIADHSDALDGAEIRQIMDTDQIPLPYTSDAPAEMVRTLIAAKNPGHDVIVSELGR